MSTSSLHSSTEDNNGLENALILQGGGSLGAFGCGVFKALANNNIKIDVVAGTSIGGINASSNSRVVRTKSTQSKHWNNFG